VDETKLPWLRAKVCLPVVHPTGITGEAGDQSSCGFIELSVVALRLPLGSATVRYPPMKRGFLYGLGTFLILGVIAGLFQFITAHDSVSVIVALVLMPMSVLVVRAARKAPPNRSKIYAVIGWLLGFIAIDAVILGIVGIVMFMH
jgi:hypothetical protein